MTREEFQLIKRIASAALDQPEGIRTAYVISACSGDAVLEREVQSLLASTNSAAQWLDTAAVKWPTVAAGRLQDAIDRVRVHDSANAPSQFAPGAIINGRYQV
ncbi:MAG: hypothetical protein ABL982_23085, partial [Vicinamibacterales bacterium]